MNKIFFILLLLLPKTTIILQSMSDQQQNQFITPEQQQRQYLIDLIAIKRKNNHRLIAGGYAGMIVQRVALKIEDGRFKIQQNSSKISDLLQQKELTQSMKKLIQNQKKKEERSRQHRLLYPKKRSFETLSEDNYPNNILSIEKHKEFVKEMRMQKNKRMQKVQQLKLKEINLQQKSQNQTQKHQQQQRIEQIQRKKTQIQKNLQKMRQNHERLLLNQKQTKSLVNRIRNKKRLHEKLKETFERKYVLPILEQNKRILQERRAHSKLSIQEIQNHEKQYLQWKKSQQSLDKSKSSSISKVQYHPPPHSKKITKILAQQQSGKHKLEKQKQFIRQKIERVNNYTSLLKEKYHTPTVSKTIATTDREKSQKDTDLSRRESGNRNNLGNKYLQEARKALRKRAKTQQGQQSTFIENKNSNIKQKTMSLNNIELKKRERYIQKSKKQQIERMLSCGEYSVQQKLKRIKDVDEILSMQLRKKQHKLKLKYNKNDNQSTLDLLLTAIKGKLNLLECYEGVDQ